MKKKKKNLLKLEAVTITLLLSLLLLFIVDSNRIAFSTQWQQNTTGWFEFYFDDAPSILKDCYFHRSVEKSIWRDYGEVGPDGLYVSEYANVTQPNPGNWTSWAPKGWKIEKSGSVNVNIGAGNEPNDGDEEEFCKIIISGQPASQDNVIFKQEGLFIDPRTYEVSLTVNSEPAGVITVLLTDGGSQTLFSQEVVLNTVGTLGWQTYAFNFNSTAKYENACIKLKLGLGAGPNGGIIWLDNITLIPLNTDIDLSYLIDKPAGNKGFLQVDPEGNYYFQATPEKKEKFFGASLNINHSNPLNTSVTYPPAYHDAKMLARRLASQGHNVARIQTLENEIFTSALDPANRTTQIDPVKLNKLDYLISELEKNGIYVLLETLGDRINRADDGVPEVAETKLHYCVIQHMFDEQHMDLVKGYINNLFNHVNPYTGKTYLNDAAIPWILLANEFYLPYQWSEQKIDGPKFSEIGFMSRTLPLSYSYKLDQMWNEYLLEKYGSRAALASAWGESSITSQPKIPGVDLIWDPDFEFSPIDEPINLESVDDWWQNDFWIVGGDNNAYCQRVAVSGEGSPPGISHALKVTLSENNSGILYASLIRPSPQLGVGAYKYSNNITHEYGSNPPFTLQANKNYVLSFWAKADTSGQTYPFKKLQVRVGGCNNSNSEANVLYVQNDFKISSEWRQYVAVFTPRFDSYFAMFDFVAGGRGNGDLYITGVHLYNRGNNSFQDFSFDGGLNDGIWDYSGASTGTTVEIVDAGLPNDQHSLKISIPSSSTSNAVVVSQGGLDIRQDQWYTLAFYAYNTDFSLNQISTHIKIENNSGQVILDTYIRPLNHPQSYSNYPGWHYYWMPFKVQGSDVNCKLKFTFDKPISGSRIYYLDQVELIGFGSGQLRNGDFYLTDLNSSLNADGWTFYGSNLAQAQVMSQLSGGNYCHVDINSGGTYQVVNRLDNKGKPQQQKIMTSNNIPALDSIRLEQNGISLEKGKRYTIRFKAKAEGQRSITAKIPAINYAGSFSLTTEWKEFSGSFAVGMPQNVLNATLAFCFGGSINDVDITDIAIEDEGDLLGLAQDETPFVPEVRYINFQPSDVALVTGYEKDSGAVYPTIGDYGWDSDVSNYCFYAPGTPWTSSDHVYNPSKESTAVIIPNDEAGKNWKIDLPDGKYLVTVACGHPNWSDSYNYLTIEDVIVFEDALSDPGYIQGVRQIFKYEVEVDTNGDGELDVCVGRRTQAQHATGDNTSLAYLIIKSLHYEGGIYRNSVQRPFFMHLPFLSQNKFNDIVDFYQDVENNFYNKIAEYLQRLGSNQHIFRTQNYMGLPELAEQAASGATANNAEWDYNPSNPLTIWNKPMLKYSRFDQTPMGKVFSTLAKNKPFLHTEYNYWFPNYTRAEGLVTKCAYDAFQDTDMLIQFNDWQHGWDDRLTPVGTKHSPAFRGMSPTTSNMMRRNDIEPAQNSIDLTYTNEEVRDSLAKYGLAENLCVAGKGVPLEMGLVTGLNRADFNAPYSKTADDYTISGYSIDDLIDQHFPEGTNNPYPGWFVSDTEQLKWNTTDGIFTLNTPNAQTIVGYLKDGPTAFGASGHLTNLAIEDVGGVGVTTTAGATGMVGGNLQIVDPNFGFANISLTTLTNEPIATSHKLLFTPIAREANTNQIWSGPWTYNVNTGWSPPTTLLDFGTPPVLAETVRTKVKIIVNSIPGYPAVKVWKLNPFGQRLEEVENVTFDGSQITIDLNAEYQNPDAKKTIWYLIERTQQTPVFNKEE